MDTATEGCGSTESRAVGTNRFAVIAIILAVVVPQIAIVFGHMARSQIRRTGEKGYTLATVAVCVGYGGVGLVAFAVMRAFQNV
ncbi:DUF4190 domain-containing protein [Mycolicibacterium mageritense]|uniref:DUF4190 domain-containing protein n=1 Tax=Mycolicibacterium mageritense TaxID=53462 RepID=UPI003C6E4DCF